MTFARRTERSTLAIHADDRINTHTDVAPPLHVSTTFRYTSDPSELIPVSDDSATSLTAPLIYSRLSNSNINRLETILAPLIYPGTSEEELGELSNQVVSYSSGLSAFHALIVALVPKRVAIGGGYHGCHGVLEIHKKMHGLQMIDLHASDEEWDKAGFGKGDIVHVETPLNPTGEAFSIQHFAERAHKRGAFLSVDATFGPPGLQDPFLWGADMVMHSGTKYIGGHSDMLCGVLATRKGEWGAGLAKTLRSERVCLGAVLGGLEGWLGVRSLRTMGLRVGRQSESADRIVGWLNDCLEGKGEEHEAKLVQQVLHGIKHASLQKEDMHWLKKQMPNGFGPVFSVTMKSSNLARALPSCLSLFHHATSLGGVESLIEWRRMSDDTVDERLLRVSVGIEDWRDLKSDLLNGFKKVVEVAAKLEQ
ncbi:PLP-dependent transferase [Delitschia confertaspora ATCC 74209]|uniref:PLP-dependent transferase n=1 Tax=Delitschia confertaspora ATCC 74209 TaxID=1513339 RepID=A0A9P4MP08_9PLEO|nr:PLP-dependent transferase [Delitschia confertaspora ATCC 74209]